MKDVPLVHVCLIAKECQQQIDRLKAEIARLQAEAMAKKAEKEST